MKIDRERESEKGKIRMKAGDTERERKTARKRGKRVRYRETAR